MAVFLGIDIGTSGTKTLAIDERGKILADATELYPSYHPKPLWSEQDPEDWWQATVKTVRATVKKAKAKASDVRAIGLSGQCTARCFSTSKTASSAGRCCGTISAPPPSATRSSAAPAAGGN